MKRTILLSKQILLLQKKHNLYRLSMTNLNLYQTKKSQKKQLEYNKLHRMVEFFQSKARASIRNTTLTNDKRI